MNSLPGKNFKPILAASVKNGYIIRQVPEFFQYCQGGTQCRFARCRVPKYAYSKVTFEHSGTVHGELIALMEQSTHDRTQKEQPDFFRMNSFFGHQCNSFSLADSEGANGGKTQKKITG